MIEYSEYAGGYVAKPSGRPVTFAWVFLLVAFLTAATIILLFRTDVLHARESEFGGDLDVYMTECAEGDMEACDTLYYTSGEGSEEEEFGRTCGGTQPDGLGGTCETGPIPLDDLRQECEAGDMVACDDLFWNAPAGSEDEEVAMTCGGAGRSEGACAETYR